MGDIYSVDPFDTEATLDALKKAKCGAGVNVVVCHAPCAVHERGVGVGQRHAPLAIDELRCNGCSLCVRVLGCPAILVTDGNYAIDQELCTGCGLCAVVCRHDAIQHAVAEAT